jgi:hypothetical protein
LVRMSNEDADMIRIADDFTRTKSNWGWPRPEPTWGITPQRWDEYRRLFRQVGLSAGLQKDGVGLKPTLYNCLSSLSVFILLPRSHAPDKQISA